MIKRKKNSTLYIGLHSVLLAVLAGVSILVEVPMKIQSYAEIFPKEKWLLTRGGNGELISSHIDYIHGRVNSYSTANFDRGEFVSLNFGKFLFNKTDLNKGDTLAIMASSQLQDDLINAVAELEIAAANLKSQKSPAKESQINEAAYRLASSEKRIQEQKIIFERISQLYKKGFVSQQEYDSNKNALEILEIEYRVNEAALLTMKTGVKPEEIALLKSQISAVKRKVDYLNEKKESFTLTAPFSGKLIPSFSPDTLLHLSNWVDAVIHIPIDPRDAKDLKKMEYANLSFSEFDVTCRVKVLQVSNEVKIVDKRQVVFVTLLAPSCSEELMPGMVLKCSIQLKTVSLGSYLYKMASR